mgnify:CR=1 FL=1
MAEDKKIQQTLVLIKPDGLKKSLTGNILSRLSETKLTIIGAKVVGVTRELAEKHYSHLKDHPQPWSDPSLMEKELSTRIQSPPVTPPTKKRETRA